MTDAAPDNLLKGRRDRAIVMLGFVFRKSEVVALNVEDLEFCDEGVRVTSGAAKPTRRAKTRQLRSYAAPVRSAGAVVAGMAGRSRHY
jgi:hypothetical protein